MKKIGLLLAFLSISVSQAQIKVKINNKAIAENATIVVEDIKTFDVAFENPKKLSYIGTGRVVMGAALYNDNGNLLEEFIVTKNGTNAVESFLADVNVFFNIIPDANGEGVFTQRIKGYDFLDFLKKNENENVKIEIKLLFFDKIGYEKYGEPIPLVKKFTFMLDNKVNAAAQKIRQAEINAKYAEKEKSDEAAKIEAEGKKKKKGLLKSVLNKF